MLQHYVLEKPDIVAWAATSIERQVRQLGVSLNHVLALAQAELGKRQLCGETLDSNACWREPSRRFARSQANGGWT